MNDCIITGVAYGTAHTRVRRAWIARFGPLDSTDYLCHLCGNGTCENLQHVYPGDAKSNMNDTLKSGNHHQTRKTHCPSGHEYTFENTRMKTLASGSVGRECRTCTRERNWRNRGQA